MSESFQYARRRTVLPRRYNPFKARYILTNGKYVPEQPGSPLVDYLRSIGREDKVEEYLKFRCRTYEELYSDGVIYLTSDECNLCLGWATTPYPVFWANLHDTLQNLEQQGKL